MVNPKRFYTYAYLRKDRTPYYIGKGEGYRAYAKHHRGISVPKDKSKIILLKQNLTEEEAFNHEIYMIAVFGRKDLGTGILRNKTNGGEGGSGVIPWNTGLKMPKEFRDKLSIAHKGKKKSEDHKRKIGASNKGRIAWNKGKTGVCPEHQKESNREMMKRRYENGYSVSGANNPRAKTWRIVFIDGRELIIKSIHDWAKKNGYSKAAIRNVYTRKWSRTKDIISIEVIDENIVLKPVEQILKEYLKKSSNINSQK